jgi:glucan phosphoethanolaminetransferase (alkaline phosphatase superfamily)
LKKYLLALWGGAERLFETHIGWVLVLFVLNYFTIVWQNVTTYHEAELPVLLIDGVFLFAGTGVYVLLLCCIPWRWLRRLLLWTSFLLSAALAGLEVFAITTYSTLVGAGIITAILQTNPREAGEFIEMYFGWHFLVSVGGFLLVVFIASRFIFPRRFSIFSRRVRNVLFPLVFVAGCIAGVVLLKGYMSFIKSNMLDIPPVRVGAATITSVENIKAYQKLSGEMKNTIRLTQNDSDTPQVVLILGEATARHRLHLYGYPLDNTPNLDALAEQGDIAVFRNVIAPEGATVAVLQKLLTFADQESTAAGRPWYHENNMVDLMNAAGYQTHWISNQESSGIWGTWRCFSRTAARPGCSHACANLMRTTAALTRSSSRWSTTPWRRGAAGTSM